MELEGSGPLTPDQSIEEWLCTEPVAIPMLNSRQCRFVLEGYPEDDHKADFSQAVKNLLAGDTALLHAVSKEVFRYYQDCKRFAEEVGADAPEIESPSDVWRHVEFGSEPMVSRREEDGLIYLSFECSCEWEREHGLQVVFKSGLHVNKVGPFDGHVTNSDAYGDDSLENAIYVSAGDL